jgi:hypothetical protein
MKKHCSCLFSSTTVVSAEVKLGEFSKWTDQKLSWEQMILGREKSATEHSQLTAAPMASTEDSMDQCRELICIFYVTVAG